MNLYLTVRDSQFASYRYRRALEEIHYLLQTFPDADKRRFTGVLAEAVLFPDSFLLTLPMPMVATLVGDFYDFIQRREEGDVSIDYLSLPSSGADLLLIATVNAPHIVDSIQALRQYKNLPFELLAHPLVAVKRHGGRIVHLGTGCDTGPKELLVILRLEANGGAEREQIEQEVRRLLEAALAVRRDRTAINARLESLIDRPGLAEFSKFFAWLRESALTPIIYRSIVRPVDHGKEDSECLGALPRQCDLEAGGEAGEALLRAFMEENVAAQPADTVSVQTTAVISPVMKRRAMVCVGVRESLESGGVRVHAFFGLFAVAEMVGAASRVPALSDKVHRLLAELRLAPDSHDYQKLEELFDLFPKVELFMTGAVQLKLIARSLIQYIQRSDAIKFLVLASPDPRAASCLVIVPRNLFREDLAQRLTDFLHCSLQVSVEMAGLIQPGNGYLGLHLLLRAETDELCIDIKPLERALMRLAKPWELKVRHLLGRALGKERGAALWRKYGPGFGPDYRSLIPPSYALRDVLGLEGLSKCGGRVIELLKPCGKAGDFRLQFYAREESFLDEYMPVLENLNLRVVDQVQFGLTVNREPLYIKSFAVQVAGAGCAPLSSLRERLLALLNAIFGGRVENDALNGLLVLTGLDWQEIDVLRAYRNFYFQLGNPFTQGSFHHALLNNANASRLLFRYFEARFRPSPEWIDARQREEAALFPLRMELLEYMQTVEDINQDRILRTLFNLIDATVRCNYHVRRDSDDYFVAFKIDSLGVIDMPVPRPKYEIYVHAPHMEGIHLRGGEVARGGIRWSDRIDDFRTEILGLMRTQMSKNALIVPKGAKGGFILKAAPKERHAATQAAKQGYITLMKGLLDLTDNRAGNDVVRLPGIVAYDGVDPYLVVAADKGTAHLPDVANEVARSYRFWLEDAFASGGSNGYSHKTLGITARGAWECVKRHFREIGRDIQREPFTVVGIGSMDGDVFGNGMLLSRCIRLRGAISGRHIFLDPDPDPEISFDERKRLFELPGSSWDDYDRSLISTGGGVFPRDAKDISLSPEMRSWLGVHHRSLDGEGLIRRLLTAETDLLWLGGIGTYVKSSGEKHEEVDDRVNDNVRVDAFEIRALVVGEGANLGFTQKARVEYNLAGGRINTDGVDNSAGVDTSDHEVNLKILMITLRRKKLIGEYHGLLERLTDEVCRQVLANNYAQSLCLSLDFKRAEADPERFLDLADLLENAGLLDRASEAFPRRKEVLARSPQLLARPELASLMAYAKMDLFQALSETPAFLSESYCRRFLTDYFPAEIRRLYGSHLDSHPLAREIKATVIANTVVNQAGSGFLVWGRNADAGDWVAWVGTYVTFDRVLEGDELRRAIYGLDGRVDCEEQYAYLLSLETTLERLCRWASEHGAHLRPTLDTLERYCEYLPQYEGYLAEQSDNGREALGERIARNRALGFSETFSRRLALIERLQDFPRMVRLVSAVDCPFRDLLVAYDATAAELQLPCLEKMLDRVVIQDNWDRQVKLDIVERIKAAGASLTLDLLPAAHGDVGGFLERGSAGESLAAYLRVYREICEASPTDFPPFLVACKALERMVAAVGKSLAER